MEIILLIAVIIIVCAVVKQINIEKPEEEPSNSVPASISPIMDFLHGFHSLCKCHKIVISEVQITWKKVKDGYEIKAYTRILKIDDQDASESVNNLRRSISQAKSSLVKSRKETNVLDTYDMKQKLILDFFGTDSLKGSFWDIDDCEYIDGKYIEFEATTIAFDALHQSRNKTLDSICSKTAQKYPDAHINRQANNTITIFFR